MNNSKLWLVVKPTVGIPLFLSAVAVGSFAVHVAVLTNTSWVGDFLSGQPLGSGDEAMALNDQSVTPKADLAAAPFMGDSQDGVREVLVILPDGTTARAVLEAPPPTDAVLRDG